MKRSEEFETLQPEKPPCRPISFLTSAPSRVSSPGRYFNLLSDSDRILDFSRATTRSCESTSRRESTAHPPSYATVRPPPRLRSSIHSFSSRRFISSGDARFRGVVGEMGGGAHKSPRARNRKHPRDGLLPLRLPPPPAFLFLRFFVFFEGRARFRLPLPPPFRPFLLVLCPAFLT